MKSLTARSLVAMVTTLLLALGASLATSTTAHAAGWTNLGTNYSRGIKQTAYACKYLAAYGSHGHAYKVRTKVYVNSVTFTNEAKYVNAHVYGGTIFTSSDGVRSFLATGRTFYATTQYPYSPTATGLVNLGLYKHSTGGAFAGTTPRSFKISSLVNC